MRHQKLALVILIGVAQLTGLGINHGFADTIVADNGFESPNQGSLYWTAKYQYNPTGTAWDFNGQTGVAANGSGFFVYNATNGNSDGTTSDLGQAAFIQNGNSLLNGTGSSSISQMIALNAGSYNLAFDAEGRDYGGGSNPISVYLENVGLTQSYLTMTLTPPSELGADLSSIAFSPFSDSFTVPATGQYALYFVGNGVAGQDVTTFVDNVNVTASSIWDNQSPASFVPLPSVAWASVSLLAGAYFMALRRRNATR